MLSDHERRTLEQIQSDLAASDPDFARRFAGTDATSLMRGLRRAYLVWSVAAVAGLLSILALALGVYTGAFLCATLSLGALVCQVWWPYPGAPQVNKGRNQ